jgi:hypothetical protein
MKHPHRIALFAAVVAAFALPQTALATKDPASGKSPASAKFVWGD